MRRIALSEEKVVEFIRIHGEEYCEKIGCVICTYVLNHREDIENEINDFGDLRFILDLILSIRTEGDTNDNP